MMTSRVHTGLVVALVMVAPMSCVGQQVHGMWVWKSPDVLAAPQGWARHSYNNVIKGE